MRHGANLAGIGNRARIGEAVNHAAFIVGEAACGLCHSADLTGIADGSGIGQRIDFAAKIIGEVTAGLNSGIYNCASINKRTAADPSIGDYTRRVIR